MPALGDMILAIAWLSISEVRKADIVAESLLQLALCYCCSCHPFSEVLGALVSVFHLVDVLKTTTGEE